MRPDLASIEMVLDLDLFRAQQLASKRGECGGATEITIDENGRVVLLNVGGGRDVFNVF